MGVLQLIAGALRWGKFIRMVPHPVMLGFVNGLAIVIGLAQLEQFKTTDGAGVTSWLAGSQLYITLALVVATMVIIWLTPKLTNRIPPPLMAIGLVTGLVLIFDVNVPRISDLASLAGGFPRFIVPDVPFSLETLQIILPYAVILAAIGLIESLADAKFGRRYDRATRGASQECLAQGTSNVVTGFFCRHGRVRHDWAIYDQY